MRPVDFLPVAVALPSLLAAHDVISTKVTWSREISRIIYRHCAGCHWDRGAAFSLASYEEARPWAKAIKEEVLDRRMPPWGAVKGFGDFRDDCSLSQEEIHLIADWAEGGAPLGRTELLPPPPDFGAQPWQPVIPTGEEPVVRNSLRILTPFRVAGIQPLEVRAADTFQVVARRPDGSIEPMLWIRNYRQMFAHPFWFRQPVALPAGTSIEVIPPDAGKVALLGAPRPAPTSTQTQAH